MSDAMRTLQKTIGVISDGAFGPNTAKAIVKHFELTPERGAHLLGQVSHESGGFKKTKESLYYSTPERLMQVWPSRFPTLESAEPYIKNPAKLAGKVYNGRMGNTSEEEAALYLGRGFLQLTGKSNYSAFAHDMRKPEVMQDPSLVENEYAMDTAIWFFEKNDLFAIADEGVNNDTIKRITKRVNGGYHGLDDRTNQTEKIYKWLQS